MVKQLYAFLLFTFLSIHLIAQPTLRGKVTDENGKALAAVNVYIPELEKRTIVDDEGKFHFDLPGKGIVRLQFSLIGYLTQIQIVDLSKQNAELIVQLESTSISMEEVIVTSNHTELARNTPYPVNSVTADDLRQKNQTTLMQALAQEPGVDIISGGGGIGKPVIRGLSFNRIVLYTMGTRLENQQWDDDHDAGIGEAGLDKVEIVYGPSALIYGADALGGAMIFVDEKPATVGKTTGDINLTLFSNTQGVNVDAGVKGTNNSGFFYQARVSDQSHTDYLQGKILTADQPSPWFAANSKFNNFNGKGKIGLSKKWGVSKLSYSYLRSNTGIIVDESEDSLANANGDPYVNRSRMMQTPYQQVDIHIVALENTLLAGNSKWNVNAAYQANNRKEFEPVLPGESQEVAMGLLLKTLSYDVKWSSNEEKKFGLVTGSQGTIQTNRNFGTNIAVPDADVNDFAGFGLMHYNMERWNFLGGLRFDLRSIDIKETMGIHEGEATLDSAEQAALNASDIKHPASSFQKYYYPFSFSIGTVYHVAKNLSVKGNMATGFSAPNYAELSTFGKHEGTNHFETGNPDLRAEQNLEGDISVTSELKNFSLSVSGFYNHIRDYIYLSPTSKYIADLQVYSYVQNNASIRGGSIGIDFHPPAASWLQWNSTLSVITGTLTDGSYLPYIPAHKIINELKLVKKSIGKFHHPYFSVVMKNYFEQNHPAENEASTPGYTLFDAYTGGEIKIKNQTLSVSLFCTNIFNTAYFNHLSIIKDIGIYEAGRNFGLSLRMSIGN